MNRQFPVKDPVSPLYKHIDWSKSVIGGSYALKQFTGDVGWEPDDVDILSSHKSKEEFDTYCNQLQTKANMKHVKSTVKVQGKIVSFDSQGNEIERLKDEKFGERDHEMFHDLIKESKTYDWNGKKIQMVFIQPQEGRSLQSVLAETTDCPSCVSYHIDTYRAKTIGGYDGFTESTKIFNIPEKGLESVMTGKGSVNRICKNRKEKYEQRGYKYF